jgi:uncharacterized membrane protein YoaK (UPF0700 family)
VNTWKLLLLAWVAGEIDTYGYLSLGQVFTTHMTGNTGVLAIAIVQGRYHDAFYRAIAIPLFFVGGMCGAALVDTAGDPRQVARALQVEAALLVAYAAIAWFDHGRLEHAGAIRVLLILLLSGLMGLQNAALTHPGTRGTHTTHLTGPLTDLGSSLTRRMIPSRRHEFNAAHAWRFASRVVGFAIGGICGALLTGVLPLAVPIGAAAMLLGLAEVERRRRDQARS